MAEWSFNTGLETPLTQEAQEVFAFYNDIKDSDMIKEGFKLYYSLYGKKELLEAYI